jgi:hypothetical protein
MLGEEGEAGVMEGFRTPISAIVFVTGG